jgi:4'-phosphopantetheinyl transferase
MRRDVVGVRVTPVGPAGPDREQLGWLPGAERRRAAGHRDPADVRRALTAAVAVRVLLAERVGADPAGVALERATEGRLVVRHPAGWHVGVSHSGGIVVCAVAPRPVGVDVETRPGPVVDAVLARRTCTPEEVAALDPLDEGARAEALLRAWVRKEAVAKAVGQGLHLPFDRLDVRRGSVVVPGTAGRWGVRDLALPDPSGEGPVAAVAAAGRWWRVDPRRPDRPGGGPQPGRRPI